MWKCQYWEECGEPCVITDKQMESDKPVCKKNKHTAWVFLEKDTCKYHNVIRCYDINDCKECVHKLLSNKKCER